MKKTLLFLLLVTSVTFSQWQLKNSGLPQGNNLAFAIDAVDQNNAVVGGRTGIYKTTDAGNNWTQISSDEMFDIAMVNSNLIYAALGRKIIKTTDGGATWAVIFQQESNVGSLNYIKVSGDEIVAMADYSSTVPDSPAQFYKSTDSGATWSQGNQSCLLNCFSADLWRRIDFASFNLGLFIYSINGQQAHLTRTTDTGASWTDVAINAATMDIVKMYDQSYGILKGGTSEAKYVYVTKDGGLTWKANPVSLGWGQALAFVKNKPAEIFLSNNEHSLFYSADSGKTWSEQSHGSSTTIRDIVFVDENCGWMVNYNGEVYWTNNKGNAVVSAEKENKLPTQYSLEQNYPNPFNPTTKISFALPEAGRVAIKIYDMLGREINTLVNSEMSAGAHSVNWNGENALREKVATGVYLYSIITNKFTQTKKMVLLK
jgi:photosystem II stability/assembly factor-like uncharacterized protein